MTDAEINITKGIVGRERRKAQRVQNSRVLLMMIAIAIVSAVIGTGFGFYTGVQMTSDYALQQLEKK